ncbi:MAG: flagellar hook-associated protein FlgK [Rhodanobacteraceae bacterium]
MADMLSIGSSAVDAYQQALDTVAENVANSATPGYSQETVNLEAVPGASAQAGAGAIGAGVDVASVTRVQSPAAITQLWSTTAANAAAGVAADAASQIDNQFSSTNLSLSGPLGNLFDSFSTWAANPSDAASRTAVLQAAETLSDQWASTDQTLDQIGAGLVQQAQSAVGQINTLTQQIAGYNQSIAAAEANGDPSPNTLLDQRDQAITSLAGELGVQVVANSSGTVNVYTANGAALVLGSQAVSASLDTSTSTGAPQLVLGSGAGATAQAQVSGGTLGGALGTLQQTVMPAERGLADVANRLAESVNTLQAAGTDENGDPGAPLFTVAPPTVTAAPGNTGSATLNASMQDATAWPAQPVAFEYTGANWTAVNTVTGQTYAVTGDGTSANPLQAAGLSVTVAGAPAAGDHFTADDSESGLGVAITDPSELAAANPLSVAAGSGNTGNATIGQLTVTDPANPALRTPVTLQFTAANEVSINGAAAVAFDGAVSANGWSLTLNGTPNAGDTFTLSSTGANSADNGVANLLANLSTQPGSDGQSVTDALNNLITSTGSADARAQGLQQAQQALLTQAQNTNDSVSGVDTNQEAADLLRFQQAYQAAAQIVASSQTTFNSLLQAVSGG